MLIYDCRLTEDYNLELQYRKPFLDIWREEKDDSILGPLSERMGVRSRNDGSMMVNDDELEAAGMFLFLFNINLQYLADATVCRALSCFLFLQGVNGGNFFRPGHQYSVNYLS